MESAAAAADLRHVREVMERTRRRVDPHAFHFVLWGAIVLAWYPLANVLQWQGRHGAMIAVGAGALLLGAVLSAALEFRLARRPRLAGAGDTPVSRQVVQIVRLSLGAAALLSAVGPPAGIIDGPLVPTVWGFAYAVMAAGVGVVYSREYLWCGGAIFLAAVASLAFPDWNGIILGPAMGLGLGVPGVIAERRVRRLAAAEADGDRDA